MTLTHDMIGGQTIAFFGDRFSDAVFLQPVDEHDASLMENEAANLAGLCGQAHWCIAAIPVRDWNTDLTPWKSAPVFGKTGFGDGAADTLRFLLDDLLPALGTDRRFYLCGYSLAGLFALWSACETDVFAGIAAVSPSLWYPGWREYADTHAVRSGHVYLSLGRKEEKTRNKVMATVGDVIREQYDRLCRTGVCCTLEWNEGNHFVNSDKRMARGLAWLLKAGL